MKVLDYEEFSSSPDYLKEYEAYKATESGSGDQRSYPYPFAVRLDEKSIFIHPTPNSNVTH